MKEAGWEVRAGQAELIFPPEEELQLLARAGPRASRAGPTASPPLSLHPQLPFSSLQPTTQLLCSDEPPARAQSNAGMCRKACQTDRCCFK